MNLAVKISGLNSVDAAIECFNSGIRIFGFKVESASEKNTLSVYNLLKFSEKLKREISEEIIVVAELTNVDDFKIRQIVESQLVDILQFNGNETPRLLGEYFTQIEVWKSFELEKYGLNELSAALASYRHSAHRFLLKLDSNKIDNSYFNDQDYKKISTSVNLGYDLILEGVFNLNLVKKEFISSGISTTAISWQDLEKNPILKFDEIQNFLS